jgi:hypothetical protein
MVCYNYNFYKKILKLKNYMYTQGQPPPKKNSGCAPIYFANVYCSRRCNSYYIILEILYLYFPKFIYA